MRLVHAAQPYTTVEMDVEATTMSHQLITTKAQIPVRREE